jgi:membrane protein implicated in regulation of membrane protease activity
VNDQPLYALTAMTGPEASSTRTVVVGVAEFPWRVLVILIIALVTGLLPAMAVWMLVGVWAVAFLIAWMFAAVWLFHGRTQSGLRIRNYAAMLNKQKAILNEFMLGPSIVHVPRDDWRVLEPGGVATSTARECSTQASDTETGRVGAVHHLFD